MVSRQTTGLGGAQDLIIALDLVVNQVSFVHDTITIDKKWFRHSISLVVS